MRQSKSVRVALLILLIGVAAGARSQPRPSPSQALEAAGDVPVLRCSPRGTTAAVPGDADDCAIWSGSGIATIIGTDKKRKPSPGLHVWDLTGREIQFVPVPRPNNVDVRQGVKLGRKTLDIAVCNARDTREIRVFKIDPKTGLLQDITTKAGIPTPELADPYGICLYIRERDGAVYAIGSTEVGDTRFLHQYRLDLDAEGRVRGTHVRAIGGEIQTYVEGLVADDHLGYVYASDEDTAVRKYHADPDSGSTQLATLATNGVAGDREGLALYDCGDGLGWILLSSQGDGTVQVFRRGGEPSDRHHQPLIAVLSTAGSKQTDGLDVTSTPLSDFPAGLLAKHDSRGRNFVLYSWADIAGALPCVPDAQLLRD